MATPLSSISLIPLAITSFLIRLNTDDICLYHILIKLYNIFNNGGIINHTYAHIFLSCRTNTIEATMVRIKVIMDTIFVSWLEPLKIRADPRITNGSSGIVATILFEQERVIC